jgi:hypothetical protein
VYLKSANHQNIDVEILHNVRVRLPDLFSHVWEAPQDGSICRRVDAIKADGTVAGMDLRDLAEFAHTMVGRKRLDDI